MNVRHLLREALGRAHYERMRHGMSPTLDLPRWEVLPDRHREPYRAKFDYVMPLLTVAVMQLSERYERLEVGG